MSELSDEWGWKFGARVVEILPEQRIAKVQFGAQCELVPRIEFFVNIPWEAGKEKADIEALALQLASSLFDELAKRAEALAIGRASSGKADGDPL